MSLCRDIPCKLIPGSPPPSLFCIGARGEPGNDAKISHNKPTQATEKAGWHMEKFNKSSKWKWLAVITPCLYYVPWATARCSHNHYHSIDVALIEYYTDSDKSHIVQLHCHHDPVLSTYTTDRTPYHCRAIHHYPVLGRFVLALEWSREDARENKITT